MSQISLGLAAIFQFYARGGLGLLPDQHLPAGLPGCPLLLLHPLLLLPPHPQLVLCHSLQEDQEVTTYSAAGQASLYTSPFHRPHAEDCQHCCQEGKESASFPSKEAPAQGGIIRET